MPGSEVEPVAAEVAVVSDSETEQRIAEAAFGVDPDLAFQKLALEAKYFAKGFSLVKKGQLEGVPFVVIAATFRPGFPREKGGNGDFVSVEAVIADKATLELSPVKHMLPNPLTVFPNQTVVFNDGGTGVRRQLVELFSALNLIDVGPGKKDENAYDRPHQDWLAGGDDAATGITADANGEPLRFMCARGLRSSEYESDYGPATTFYIG